MDNLTHTATGIFLRRTGLGRGVPHAGWLLVLGANAPDIDVVALAGGTLTYLSFHRHATHALPFVPLMALLPVLVVRWASRKPIPWKRAYGLSLIGVASHLALDLTNMYGVRLLVPFTSRWFQWSTTAIIDLWIWAVFLVALAAPALARLVHTEIGSRSRPPVRGFALFALLFLVSYTAGRAVLHRRAAAVLESRLYDGAAPLRVAALPGIANPFRWRGLVETPAFFSEHEVDLLSEFDPLAGRRFYKLEPQSAIEMASRTRAVRDFLEFSQFPWWRVSPVVEPRPGTLVEVMDLRFGSPPASGFAVAVVMDEDGRVLRESAGFGAARPR